MEELWKNCPEYEDHYEISNLGNIRSKATFIPHSGNWNKDVGGYIKKRKLHNTHINRYGYVATKLCKYGKCRTLTVHRLVAKAFIENPNKYIQVNHINGQKNDNTVTNLEWISRSGNMQHAWDTGLIDRSKVSGQNHHKAKLTQENVNLIRTLFNTKTFKQIAEQFKVSISTILDIKYKRTWVN